MPSNRFKYDINVSHLIISPTALYPFETGGTIGERHFTERMTDTNKKRTHNNNTLERGNNNTLNNIILLIFSIYLQEGVFNPSP